MTQDTQYSPAGPETLTLDLAVALLSGQPQDDEKESPIAASAETDASTPDAKQPIPFEDWLTHNGLETSTEEPSETSGADEQRVKDSQAVKPPASWTGSDQAIFQTLPRELQERVAAREQERERVVNEALRGQAESRKAVEAQRVMADHVRQHAQMQLEAMIPALHGELGAEFADIRTPADMVVLAQKDPARYAVLRAKQDALHQALVQTQSIQLQTMQQHQAERLEVIKNERAALLEKRPELRDKAAAQRFGREIRDYVVGLGYPPDVLDGNLSHLDLLVLEKAMLYDRAQRARAEGAARPVPRVQSPGTAETRGERAAGERVSKLKRLERSGRIEDAVGLLRL